MIVARRASRGVCGLVALAAWAMLAPLPAASACSCEAPRSQQSYRDAAEVVFTGTAVDGPEDSGAEGFVSYEFEVERVEKGQVDEVEAVDTGQDTCGLEFVVGEVYRVFAARDGEALATGLCSGTLPESQPAVDRVAGSGRLATAAAVSGYRRDLECRGGDCPPAFGATAVLARADDYADGLAGTPVAGGENGPLLLTGGDRLADEAAGELRRLGTQEVLLLGGPAVISAAVERDVRSLGADVRRIAGSDRYATAAAAAALEVGGRNGVAFVASGSASGQSAGWPDALAAGAAAGPEGAPLLLTQGTRLPESTRDALRRLGVTRVVLAGGTAAVSEEVEDDLRDVVGEVVRLGGATRYDTARLLADRALFADRRLRVHVVTGRDWPDSLGAGAAAYRDRGVLLPVDGRDPAGSPPTREWLQEQADRIDVLTLVGGTAAITSEVEEALADDVNAPG